MKKLTCPSALAQAGENVNAAATRTTTVTTAIFMGPPFKSAAGIHRFAVSAK
jgi:hypothetical protein